MVLKRTRAPISANGSLEEDEITWYSNNTLVALEAKHALEKSKIAWFSNNATL